MARILTDETTLTRKRGLLKKESRVLRLLVVVEAILAAIILLAGAVLFFFDKGAALLAAGLIVAFLATGHWQKIRENEKEYQSVSAGLKGEQEVTRHLKDSLSNDCYILNDLQVRHGWKRAQMDHLVVTPQGIFVVETKTWRGEIEGDENDARWTQVRRPGAKPIKLANPVHQNRRQVEVLRQFLQDSGIDWPDIHPVLVSRSPEATFWIRNATVPILKPSEVARFISKPRSGRLYTEKEITAVIELLKKKAR